MMPHWLTSGSVLGAALSLAVTTMGAGILTLPSAFADGGILPTALLMIFVACLTVHSVDFIIHSVDRLGLNSYEEITRELLGRQGEAVVRWMLILYNIGSAIGYLVVIGNLFEPLQPIISFYVPFLTTSKHTLLLFWAVVMMPMSCIPKLGSLHASSFLAIFATSLISAMIVLRYFVPGPVSRSISREEYYRNMAVEPLWWWGRHPLLALPIVMFSFDCQSLVFQVYANLDDMRRRTMFSVSLLSLTVSTIIHGAVGIFGYLSNPGDVRDNIISNYDPNVDALFAVGYLVYAVPINLAFVLILFPIRDSIFILWYGFSSASAATHVPRQRDFTRITAKEEALEERERELVQALLLSHSNSNSNIPDNAKPMMAMSSSNGSDAFAVAHHNNSYGAVVAVDYDAPAKAQNGNTIMSSSFQVLTNGNGNDNNNGSGSGSGSEGYFDDAVTEAMLSQAESERVLLQHRKKQTNDVEVIPLKDHLIVSVTLSTCCMAVALVAPDIVAVVAFLGGLCSSTLCFTCPALYRLALHRNGLSPFDSRYERCVVIVMLAFGLGGGMLGTLVALRTLI